MKTNLNTRLKWSKTFPVAANILSAVLFLTAYSMRPVVWFLVAAGVNIIVAVLIIILFNKFEKKFARMLNKSDPDNNSQ